MRKLLWSAEQTARWLGIPRRWLIAEAEADRLPHLRIGSQFYFDPETVQAALLALAREPQAVARA